MDAGRELASCPGRSITLQAISEAPNLTDVTYEWVPGRYLSDSTILNPVARPPAGINIKYTLIATTTAECKDTSSMILHIWPSYNFRIGIRESSGELSFNNPALVRSGVPIQLQALPDSLTNFQWTIADSAYIRNIMDDPMSRTPIVSITDTTRFFVTAVTPELCPVHTEIYLMIAGNLLIPTGFTPNSDGINDFWQIGNAEAYYDIEVAVFNRWALKYSIPKDMITIKPNLTVP